MRIRPPAPVANARATRGNHSADLHSEVNHRSDSPVNIQSKHVSEVDKENAK